MPVSCRTACLVQTGYTPEHRSNVEHLIGDIGRQVGSDKCEGLGEGGEGVWGGHRVQVGLVS